MQRPLGRPKDLMKKQAILEAAKDLFLEHGYDGCSMEKIAQQAGVSKLTVYNHFKDKTHLFTAAIEMVCDQRLPKYLFQLDKDTSVQQFLTHIATAFNRIIYSEEAIKLNQLMASLIPQNTEIAHMFYAAGPGKTVEYFREMFRQLKTLALLDIRNDREASVMFISLLSNYYYQRVIWQLEPFPSAEQIDEMAARQVEQFLKLYPLKK